MGKDFTNQLVRMMAACADKGGMDVEIIPSNEEICKAVRFMLEESLFFHPQIVDGWHGEMVNSYRDNKGLYVRFSKKMKDVKKGNDGVYYYEKDKKRFLIDKDGNAKVRQVIKENTGEIVSQGTNSSIKFVKISHVWGEATNPFYFTSLWNIVLIPAYCNDLMDKLKGDIPEIVQSVFRAVCREIYEVKEKLSGFGLHDDVGNDTKVVVLNDDKTCVRVEIPKVGVIDSVQLHYLGNPFGPEQKSEDVHALDLVNPESYDEKDIAAYSLLEDLSSDSRTSFKSCLNGVLSLLDRIKEKGMLSELGVKPKTLSNYKWPINRVLNNLEDLERD
jgi:hypothetical protein